MSCWRFPKQLALPVIKRSRLTLPRYASKGDSIPCGKSDAKFVPLTEENKSFTLSFWSSYQEVSKVRYWRNFFYLSDHRVFVKTSWRCYRTKQFISWTPGWCLRLYAFRMISHSLRVRSPWAIPTLFPCKPLLDRVTSDFSSVVSILKDRYLYFVISPLAVWWRKDSVTSKFPVNQI